MRKLFLITAGFLLNVLMACNSNPGGMSATAKKNKEVNDAIMKAHETGDFSKMGDYITADAVDHGGWTGELNGLDNIVADMKKYHEQMPDMKSETIKTLADDEYVMVWSKVNGTPKTDMMAMKAGQPFSMTRVDVSKFKDGKAVEHWIFLDPKEVVQLMAPQTPASNPTSSDAVATNTEKKAN